MAVLVAFVTLVTACGNEKKEVKPADIDTSKTETTDSVAKKEEEKKPAGPNLKGTENQLAFMEKCGAWDRYKTGILPQMAREVPEYSEKLLNSEYPYFIIVDKNKMKLFLYDKYGNIVKNYGIACARNYGTKHVKGDSRTADGFFSAEGIYDSQNWRYTNDRGYTSPARGVFGPKFIRVDVPGWRCIGIHGTSSPGSIGSRASHGCVRLTNDNILDLVQYAQVGMPIIISPGPKDMAVNASEGYNIPSVTTEPGGTRAVAGQQAMDPKAKSDNAAAAKAAAANKQKEAPKATEKPKASQETAAPAPKAPASETLKEKTDEKPVEKPAAEPKQEQKAPAPKPEPKPESKPAAPAASENA